MNKLHDDKENHLDINNFLGALPLPGVVIGFDEIVHFSNNAAQELFGELIKSRHYITVMRDPEISDAIETVIQTHETQAVRWITTISNVDIVFDVHIAAIDSQHILATFKDSTQVEKSKQLRRDFVSNVSHELKTPLTSIMGFLETIQTVAKSDAKAQERFLSIMSQEAHRMDRLVNDLMSLNRVENEERSKPSKQIDLVKLIKTTIQSIQPICAKTKNSINFENELASVFIPGDSDQLKQVGREKEIKLILRKPVYQSLLRKEGLVLSVVDQGPGIEEQHIPRLTERFYRVDDHRSRQVGGTGLGLSIVKHILNRHRGRLRIESELEKGTSVSIFLPTEA